MASGLLTVQVKNASSALPISNATIYIYDESNTLLYELTTDEGGSSPQVSLDTVDASLSLDPNYTGFPYTNYYVDIKANGYNDLTIENVRIFDNQASTLPVSLIPLSRQQTEPSNYEITLSEPSILQESPREQEGPLREPRVLRQVVIPDPITVHLGPPDSHSSNVKVPFIDYIKNVASSEIYPTWPENALKANIYAITTFALNRVFTEWYRGRGYDFDITNSTAYDQYYVYGQTIYDSISKIVDDQFNEYVTRNGNITPYFTSFCNGTTATCDGLSQWGTVSLANDGMDYMDILQYYYGNDIEIQETNFVTNILSSYPGSPLKVGSGGLDVQTIQTYLKSIKNNFPSIPTITDADGVFGSSTEDAVKQFQRIFNLTIDGIVGKDTWNQISRIFVAVNKLSELDSEGDALGVGTIPPNATLRLGSSGNNVLTLQYILDYISLFYPTIPTPSRNGQFDAQTRSSVIAFQNMMGLTADGIVGKNTWNELYDVYLGIINSTKPPTPNPNYINYVVKSGDTLWLLSIRYNTTVDAIKKLNGLTSNNLYIGQQLKIPNSNPTPSVSYTVKSGDTLWLLSRRYNTSVDAIKRLNGLTSDSLSIGQVLQIPAA